MLLKTHSPYIQTTTEKRGFKSKLKQTNEPKRNHLLGRAKEKWMEKLKKKNTNEDDFGSWLCKTHYGTVSQSHSWLGNLGTGRSSWKFLFNNAITQKKKTLHLHVIKDLQYTLYPFISVYLLLLADLPEQISYACDLTSMSARVNEARYLQRPSWHRGCLNKQPSLAARLCDLHLTTKWAKPPLVRLMWCICLNEAALRDTFAVCGPLHLMLLCNLLSWCLLGSFGQQCLFFLKVC